MSETNLLLSDNDRKKTYYWAIANKETLLLSGNVRNNISTEQ